jgi:hypothetical protein
MGSHTRTIADQTTYKMIFGDTLELHCELAIVLATGDQIGAPIGQLILYGHANLSRLNQLAVILY